MTSFLRLSLIFAALIKINESLLHWYHMTSGFPGHHAEMSELVNYVFNNRFELLFHHFFPFKFELKLDIKPQCSQHFPCRIVEAACNARHHGALMKPD